MSLRGVRVWGRGAVVDRRYAKRDVGAPVGCGGMTLVKRGYSSLMYRVGEARRLS